MHCYQVKRFSFISVKEEHGLNTRVSAMTVGKQSMVHLMLLAIAMVATPVVKILTNVLEEQTPARNRVQNHAEICPRNHFLSFTIIMQFALNRLICIGSTILHD